MTNNKTTTLSVRLEASELEQVEQAASLLGWSPTQLLKQSVLVAASKVITQSKAIHSTMEACGLMEIK